MDVEYARPGGGTRHDKAWLVDFSDVGANDWLAVNQFTVVEGQHNRRPDIVVFVNGLPLALIEPENAADVGATIWSAYAQMQTCKAEIPAAGLQRRAGGQRKRGAGDGRRQAQGDRGGVDHPGAQERDHRLDAARGRAGEDPGDGQAHPQLLRLPARLQEEAVRTVLMQAEPLRADWAGA